MLRRLVARFGLWCLRRAHVPAITCSLDDGVPRVIIFTFEEDTRIVSMLIFGAMHTYCEAAGVDVPEASFEQPVVH